MSLRGNISVETLDIKLYDGVYNIACGNLKKLDVELIPSFIINESVLFFSQREEYEKCSTIQSYFNENKDFVIDSSREDWYGCQEKDNNKPHRVK